MVLSRRPDRLITQSVVFEDIAERDYAAGILIFLTEISLAVESLLNYEQVLNRVVHLAIPKFADYCLLDITGEDGTLQRLAIAHRDPDKERLMHRLQTGTPELVRIGSDLRLFRSKPPEAITGTALDSVLAEVLCPVSCISVPLAVRERKLGVVTFVTAESGRYYCQEDLTVAKLMSRHFAAAIDNARQFEAECRARIAAEQALAETRTSALYSAGLSTGVRTDPEIGPHQPRGRARS